MIIDGVLGSEAIDSSGEVLSVKGADISDVDKGTLLLNWEHQPGEQGASTIVGKIVYAKKIYSEKDCENERQRKYWREVKLPYIYGIMRLYDGAGHEEAKRIAAMIRDHAANEEPITCRLSVEGSTLSRKDNYLEESIIRRVAVTVKPCNKTANTGLLEDPNAPEGFDKDPAKLKEKDILADVARKSENPMFMRLGGSHEITCNPLLEESDLIKNQIYEDQPLRPDEKTPSEPGYVYHATNESRALDISQQGLLTHKPWEHTEQDMWPDGGVDKRSYHSPKAHVVWAFAPQEGKPVILRTHQSKHAFKAEEGTGDVYTKKPIHPQHLEIGMADGSWKPLTQWAGLSKALEAGIPSGAADTLTQGAALQAVSTGDRKKDWAGRAKKAIETYKSEVFSKEEFRAHLKHELPEASDDFINYFEDIAEDFHVRRKALKKGVNQRIAPFTPSGALNEEGKLAISSWQNSHQYRSLIPKMEGPERIRALNRLTANTKTRRGPDGGIQYLLHRGMGPEERSAVTEVPGKITHRDRLSSWSPDYHVARSFAEEYSNGKGVPQHTMSAWVNANNIHSIPMQYGKVFAGDSEKGRNTFRDEYEVLVAPHQSDVAAVGEAKDPHWSETVHSRINHRAAPVPLSAKEEYQAGYLHSENAQKSEDSLALKIRLDNLGIQLRKAVRDIQDLGVNPLPKVHRVLVNVGGKEHLAGRAMVLNGKIVHLEDYHDGLMEHLFPQGPTSIKAIANIRSLKKSPHLRIEEDFPPELEEQMRPKPVAKPLPKAPVDPMVAPAMEAPPIVRPPSVFDYHRVGMERPHTLEVHEGTYLLDGNRLQPEEVHTILGNVRQGTGSIRYKSNRGQIEKMEVIESLEELMKAVGETDEDRQQLHEALTALRAAVASGHVEPKHERTFTKWLYEDRMVPGVGNKHAAMQFLAQNKPGVYASLDGNDFSSVNNFFGHEAGDAAIKAMGKAAREAMDEAVGRGPGGGKMFRNPDEQDLYRAGGDEILCHFPSHEHAAKFSRLLSQKLQDLPPINGTHKLSMSFGFGLDFKSADKALAMAKEQKYHPGQEHLPHRERTRIYKSGEVPNLAHSLVPGHEGPLPVHNEGHSALHQNMTHPEVAPVVEAKKLKDAHQAALPVLSPSAPA